MHAATKKNFLPDRRAPLPSVKSMGPAPPPPPPGRAPAPAPAPMAAAAAPIVITQGGNDRAVMELAALVCRGYLEIIINCKRKLSGAVCR
jgi:hypothetical protein